MTSKTRKQAAGPGAPAAAPAQANRMALPRAAAVVCVVTLCAAAPAAGGPVYRWVDEHGAVHYGDRPQGEGAQAVELDRRALNLQPVPQERLERQKRILDAYAEERRRERAARARREAEEAQRRRACHEVRDRLRQMTAGGFVWYDLDAQGERVYLDDAALQARIGALRERERAVCG